MSEATDPPLTRSQRRLERINRLKQIEQRYRRERQRNILAQPGRHPFALVLDNLKAGYNVPKIFRSTQAFSGAAVHLVNVGVFDPAAAKGAFRKVPAHFHDHFPQAHAALRAKGYTLYALTADGEESLPDTWLPEKSAFIIGNEEFGLSFNPAHYPDIRTLAIPLPGQMESLNASIAASIVMYEYLRQHADRASQDD